MNLVLVAVVRNIKNAVESEFTKGDLYQQKRGNLNQHYSNADFIERRALCP